MTDRMVLKFKIELEYLIPLVWRRILISRDATFFDLHMAIQQSMGWENCHMHMFTIKKTRTSPQKNIGLPSEYDPDIEPAWELKVVDYFKRRGSKVAYEYDFGDSWLHKIIYEGTEKAVKGRRYPQCLDGERACPPEDCGGTWGYEGLLNVLRDPQHEDYEDRLEWLGDSFDPEAFDAKKVVFKNTAIALEWAMEGPGM